MSNVKIAYTKIFESGILEGSKIKETMSFVDTGKAMDWVVGVNTNPNVDYYVVDVEYVVTV